MKKVLGLTLGAGLAIAAVPSYAMDDFIDNLGIYGAGIYDKPSNNGLSFGATGFTEPTSSLVQNVSPYNRGEFLSPGYDWDYSLGISYHFPCSQTRGFIEYDRFHDNDSRAAPGVAALGYAPHISVDATLVNANVHEKLQAYRFGLKHFLPLGDYFSVSLAGFFEYNKVTRALYIQVDPTFASTVTPISGPAYGQFNNEVHGWGPGVGLKFAGIPWSRYCNFSLFAATMVNVFFRP